MLRPALFVIVSASLTAPHQAPPVSGGLSMDQVATVVKAHSKGLGACWDTEYKRLPQPRGDALVGWQVDTAGSVTSANVVSATSTPLGDCIVREVKSWRFPKADTSTSVSGFPFHFVES